jgi:hypothetical protein
MGSKHRVNKTKVHETINLKPEIEKKVRGSNLELSSPKY